MEGGRKAECPSCGAPIEWKLGSSHALVCSYCRFSVVRSDRDLKAIGKVADLVPTAPPLAVGDTGSIGGRGFRVAGRLQLDHGRGPWDEWYIGFADETWAWLARAQGRWYVTYAREASGLPSWDQLTPGAVGVLPGTGSLRWTVSQRGGSALLSAEGELPFAVVPQASGRYVDLEGEGGAFATIDYGDGSEPAQLFSGRELAPNELVLKQSAEGPRPSERVEVKKLACPKCGGPISIFVPGETERCGCPSCGALLDHNAGVLRLLMQFEPPKLLPLVPLGSEGELLGQRRMVIGFMQRHVEVEGERFAWREYLLHSSQGYSWLVEDNHHWVHVTPVPTSAVQDDWASARYRGRRYKRFAVGEPVVDFVIGEFYWKVIRGDTAHTIDFIDPPRILSVERSENEINWSEGEYVEPGTVFRAFGIKGKPPEPSGVSPAQPNPHSLRGATLIFAVLALLWLVLAFSYELVHPTRVIVDKDIPLPASETAIKAGAPRPDPTFTDEFEIKQGPTTLELEIESSLDNGWVGLGAALLHEGTGDVEEVDLLAEYYHGVSDGESWSEGSRNDTQYFGGLEAGRYVLRLEPSWDAWGNGWATLTSLPTLRLKVTEGARSPWCCFGSFLLIALPFLLRALRRASFEQSRRENANP